MKSRLLAASVLFLVSAAPAHAASGWSLTDSAETINSWIEQQLHLIKQDQTDVDLEGGAEMFPVSGSGVAMSEAPAIASPYVQFSSTGRTIILTDVPSSAWFGPFVRDAAERGIVSGYRDAAGNFTGLYGPANNVTLEELAKMAFLAAQLSQATCPGTAKNPKAAGRWSEQYIACAESEQLAVYADGTVDITRPATRAEVTVTILQAFGAALRDVPPSGVKLKDVSDSTLFANAIYAAVQSGVVTGDTDAAGNLTGYFRPHDAVNRAEVAKILSAAMQVYGGGNGF